MYDEPLSLTKRLWLAWVCWFRILVDGRFASRVEAARTGELGAPESEPEVNEIPDPAPEPSPLEPSTGAALQLLAMLQREGRLVDFLEQDVSSFDDAAIGAAARVVHDGCRRALRAHATIVPVRDEPEGTRIALDGEFDPAAIKLTGNVGNGGLKNGILRHRGWRTESLRLPKAVGPHDPAILAPAEIEL